MSDAVVRFEREDAEGIVAIGSYLSDAAKRFGVRFDPGCSSNEHVEHTCAVEIRAGGELLSEKTSAEQEILKDLDHGDSWRLACHAKIERAGDVVIMTKDKPKAEEEKEKDQAEDYRKRFEELPLERKMAELVRLESIALSETLSFVINSPYKVADKVMDLMAEFGFKLDKEKKEASKPEEHRTNGSSSRVAPENSADADKQDTKDKEGD